MKHEVRIILFPELHKSKNGAFFEDLMRPIFEKEGYKIEMNVNFTGLEIDLLGNHRNRKEKVLVECKAKKKVNSDEIKKFYYNLLIAKKADYGYFFYTQELDHQASGLKSEHEENHSKVSTFFGPEKIIASLSEIGKIKKFDKALISSVLNVTKLILAYTYYGCYYIIITHKGTESKEYHVFDAYTLNSINNDKIYSEDNINIVKMLELDIIELNKYNHREIFNQTLSLFSANTRSYTNFSEKFNKYLNSTDSIFAHSKVDEVSMDEIFVFPDIKHLNSDKKIAPVLSLYKLIHKNTNDEGIKLALFGDNVSGKTTCCKNIIIEYFNKNMFPILIKGSDIKNNIRTASLLRITHKAYDSQYETNIPFDNLEKNKIVLIIDDFHLVNNGKSKHWNMLIENLKIEFLNIIITGDENTLVKIGLGNKGSKTILEDFNLYEILELGPKLRVALIDKWYKLGNDSNFVDKNEVLTKLDKAQKHIKTLIGKNYVPSYPFYILAALQALESSNIQNSDYSIYGSYYELLIKNTLGKNLKDKQEFNLYINYLSHFAYYLFEITEKEISFADFSQFHSVFCTKIAYKFSEKDAIKTLVESKIFSIHNNTISFKENYIYYYFVADFLSKRLSKLKIEDNQETSERENAKDIIKKLIQRVYRDEYASIVMFLTHLSKDEFIITVLIENAKNLFSENAPCLLEKDIQRINNLVKKLPEQVIELIDVEESRQEALEEKERTERINKEIEKEIEKESFSDNKAKLDEDVNTIDYFAKYTLALKTLDLLGQIARAYWGELDATEKNNIVLETYNLGLRTLNSYLLAIENNSDEIVEHLSQVIEEKHIQDRYELKKTIKESVQNFIFRISFLASWSVTKRITNAVGTPKLKETYNEVLRTNNFTSFKLINLSIKLDHNTKIPFNDIKKHHKDFSKNNLASIMLQNLVINHLYMFNTKISEKQKICNLLGIGINQQRLIDKASKIKKQ